MRSLSQEQFNVAQKFASATIDILADERGVHAETAIAGAARMAGTFLFHSFGFPVEAAKAGQPVLSEQANEHGPVLMEILGNGLDAMNVAVDVEKLGEPTPLGNEPLLKFLETQTKLEPKFNAIAKQAGLSLDEAAHAAALATAHLIKQCSQVLDPNIAFGIAVYGFIEGTKTYPANFEEET